MTDNPRTHGRYLTDELGWVEQTRRREPPKPARTTLSERKAA